MRRLPSAPSWATPVRVRFVFLVLSGSCRIRTAWSFSRGALTSPYIQDCMVDHVQEWRCTRDRALGNIRDCASKTFGSGCNH